VLDGQPSCSASLSALSSVWLCATTRGQRLPCQCPCKWSHTETLDHSWGLTSSGLNPWSAITFQRIEDEYSSVRNSPDSFRFCALCDSVTPWLGERILSSIDALLVSLNFSRRALVADAVKNTPESDAQVDREEAR
jgi:hypothetical protein